MARQVPRVTVAGRRTSLVVVRAIVIALAVAGLGGCGGADTDARGVPASLAVAAHASPSPTAAPSAVGQFRSVRRYAGIAVPVRLRIPEAGIDTSLERLGLTADGWIAAPREWDVAGWFAGGPRPGQSGPSAIVGHVDSRSGPAVFYQLPRLRMGAAVHVDRQDGTSVTFRVTARRQVPKNQFPADDVYAPTLQVSLLLITCGGVFDPATGHYRDNVLVTAVPDR